MLKLGIYMYTVSLFYRVNNEWWAEVFYPNDVTSRDTENSKGQPRETFPDE